MPRGMRTPPGDIGRSSHLRGPLEMPLGAQAQPAGFAGGFTPLPVVGGFGAPVPVGR